LARITAVRWRPQSIKARLAFSSTLSMPLLSMQPSLEGELPTAILGVHSLRICMNATHASHSFCRSLETMPAYVFALTAPKTSLFVVGIWPLRSKLSVVFCAHQLLPMSCTAHALVALKTTLSSRSCVGSTWRLCQSSQPRAMAASLSSRGRASSRQA
jgi:hypothetical protein